MFKLMKKSDLDSLNQKMDCIRNKLSESQQELHSSYLQVEETEKHNEELKEQVRKLEEQIEESARAQLIADSNIVELQIANDLTSVVPVVRFRQDVFEKMVELGYLSDKDSGNDMAIQVALMTISHEALQQIIDSFSEPVED